MKNERSNQIAKAVESSRASAALEGICESEYIKEMNKQLVSGKITITEAIKKTREKYGLKNLP